MGEMNKPLLKKVEELTLYLIEKDKKQQACQKELVRLRKDMQELKKEHPTT